VELEDRLFILVRYFLMGYKILFDKSRLKTNNKKKGENK